MRSPSEITPQQAEILQVLWDRGEATVSDVRDHLSRGEELARTTVNTVLSRMESYGWATRERRGREFVYRPALTKPQVRASQVKQIVGALFPDDLPSLVSHALRESDWHEEDLERIEEMIRRHRERRAAAPSTSPDGSRSAGGSDA